MDNILHDNGGRRSGIDRHQYLYSRHIPERRSGEERRCENDRRLKPRLKEQWASRYPGLREVRAVCQRPDNFLRQRRTHESKSC